MFKANQDTDFVATKIVSIKPEAQINYNSQVNQIRWLLPQYLGFVDPSTLYLKYNLTMSGRGNTRPDGRAGVHSLLRDFRIQDGTGRAELEMLQDYNVNTAQVWGYTSNRSIDHKREMFEGKSSNANLDNQLFWTEQPAWNGAGPAETSATPKNVQIQQPLYSGVLGPNAKVFPLVATQGLRCQMTLDTVSRSCVLPLANAQGQSNAVFLKSALLGATGADDAAKWIKANIDDTFDFPVKSQGHSEGRRINRNASPTNNNPFFMGDMVYIALADGSAERQLGVVDNIGKDAQGDCSITVIPNRAIGGTGLTIDYPFESIIYYKQADRMVVQNYTEVGVGTAAGPWEAVGWTISDLEMLVAQVQPPQMYVEKLMNQVQSSQGLSLDYRTDTLYRFNLTSINGLTNQFIPANQHRAYTILSVPLDQDGQGSIEESSFKGLTDGCQNYQYVFGGSLIPDRRVDLERYNQDPARTDALHVIELEKALVNANHGVRDLQRIPDRFLIGRGLSKYGQIFNLDTADLSLRVEYQGATKAKMFEHFVNHLRRVTISSQGVQVIT